MRRKLSFLLITPLMSGLAASIGFAAQSSQGEGPAYAWHDSSLTAMGGKKGWEKTRYLRFRWNVYRAGKLVSDRRHYWDRYDGDYRLETKTRDGDSLLALFNVNNGEGQVWVDGKPAEGARNDSLVERAYAMFINDSYWLLMPYKWRDPGVNLEYLGQETHDDGTWHVVHLSFENVGLTPGDQYWAYISDEPPHLMKKWQYHLQNRENKGPVIRWENWQRFGDMMIATERNAIGEDFRIEFAEVQASRRVPRGTFKPPGVR